MAKKKVVIDFSNEAVACATVQEITKGLKTRTEVSDTLKDCQILPEPGCLYGVQGTTNGFSVLFLIGEGKRPRVVECVEPEFYVLA